MIRPRHLAQRGDGLGARPAAKPSVEAELDGRWYNDFRFSQTTSSGEGIVGGKSIAISDRTFEQEVLKAPTAVVVDFWAEWCPPCKMIAPILEEIATEKNGRLKIAKLDTDENPATPQRFGVMSLPTLLVFKNGQEVARLVSFRNKSQLLQQIERAIGPRPWPPVRVRSAC